MVDEKINSFIRFSDPLLNGFSQISIPQGLGPNERNLILKIGDTILKARAHPKPVSVFSKFGDPVLQSVFELLDRERYHFSWTMVVILGCSAGGGVALRTLFRNINVPHLPIILAMHHNSGFKFMSQFEMANSTYQRVLPVNDGDPIRGSRVYFLPGEKELGISPGTASFGIKPLPYKPRFRPDINKAMAAVSIRFRENSVGVILSGMLDDGAEGAKVMSLNRGEVWVQEPASAMFKEMPRATIKVVPSARIGSLQQIANRINRLSRQDLRIEPTRLTPLFRRAES